MIEGEKKSRLKWKKEILETPSLKTISKSVLLLGNFLRRPTNSQKLEQAPSTLSWQIPSASSSCHIVRSVSDHQGAQCTQLLHLRDNPFRTRSIVLANIYLQPDWKISLDYGFLLQRYNPMGTGVEAEKWEMVVEKNLNSPQ